MKFNAKKLYLLSMHSKRGPTLNKYRLKGEDIVKTSHHSYLGIQDDGKWSKHVENCTKNTNRALEFIRQNVGRCPESIKETLYTAMVRPRLEYASGAWNPHLKKANPLTQVTLSLPLSLTLTSHCPKSDLNNFPT